MQRPINLWFALLGLGSSKLRSFLTILGIVIGVAAVIMIVSLGNGLQNATAAQMESMAAGTITVTAATTSTQRQQQMTMRRMQTAQTNQQSSSQLEALDVEALRLLGNHLDGIASILNLSGSVAYQGQDTGVSQILAVSPEWLHVYERQMYSGRFFSACDEESAAPVAIIDKMLVSEFFGENSNPVGEVIHLALGDTAVQDFSIIGILATDGDYSATASSLLVPLRTGQLRLAEDSSADVSTIAVRVDSRDSAERETAVAEIATLLRARHGIALGAEEDFQIVDSLSFSEEMTSIIQTITLVLSLIAGISLLVGSIGLMNIMLVAVSERTWEIGMRRAIGAYRADILSQFLSEAVLLSLLGGLIGMALGILGSYAVSRYIEALTGYVNVSISVVGIAVGVSTVVGVISGIYPALRASQLQPTEALRHAV